MSTSQRQAALANLVSQYAIEDQQQLVALLQKEHGIDTNQAQVSRDLKRLRIVKQPVGGKMIYVAPSGDSTKEILLLAIQGVYHNESMIVLKTTPGLAPFVGDYLDLQDHLPLLGTIAGENTVFVVPQSIKQMKQTYQEICHAVYFTP